MDAKITHENWLVLGEAHEFEAGHVKRWPDRGSGTG